MTKIGKKIVKCVKCCKESEQMIVYSVNFSFGNKESNEALMRHQQKCPHCGYETIDITRKEK